MIDGGLRGLFRTQLTKRGYQFTPIETGGTTRGVPDSEYCSSDGISGWLEYKQTKANTVQISPEQVGWVLQRNRCNGKVFIAIRKKCSIGKRRKACDELWLLHGKDAALLKEFGLSCKEIKVLGIWSGGPKQWNWNELDLILRGK